MAAALATFTGHTLPILANWSQFVGCVTLATGAGAWYMRHRCFHCRKLARYHIGDHRVPVCHTHREREAKAQLGAVGRS